MSSSSSMSSDSSVNLNKKKTNNAEKKKKKKTAIAGYSCDCDECDECYDRKCEIKIRKKKKYFGVWTFGAVAVLINVYKQYVDKKVEAGHSSSSHIHFESKEWMSMCDTFQAELRHNFWFDEIEVSEMRSKIMAMKNAPSPELEAIKNHNVELWDKWCKCCSLTENTGKSGSGSIQTQSSHKTSTSRAVKSDHQKLEVTKVCDDAFAILNDMDIKPDVYMRAATMILNTEDHYIVKEFTQLNKSDRLSYLINVMLQN